MQRRKEELLFASHALSCFITGNLRDLKESSLSGQQYNLSIEKHQATGYLAAIKAVPSSKKLYLVVRTSESKLRATHYNKMKIFAFILALCLVSVYTAVCIIKHHYTLYFLFIKKKSFTIRRLTFQ